MDDFVKTAFKEAGEALADEEFRAYGRHFGDEKVSERFNMITVLRTGVEDMTKLLQALGPKETDTLSLYIVNLVIGAFHEGYTARMEDER